MGTWATLTLVTDDSSSVADLAYKALEKFHRADSLMSNWTETSEVARINRLTAGREATVHPEVARVLGVALEVYEQSGGAFDITVEPLVRLWGFLEGTPRVPAQGEIDAALERVGADKLRFDPETRVFRFTRDGVRVDLGGIAKGYAVDRVVELLRSAGIENALVDLSGNMVGLGSAPTHEGWYVGIRDPSGEHPYHSRIHLYNEGVATSGDYEQFVDAGGKRYGHILDPRTGWSARGSSSVTVVNSSAMVADAWATALFVLGPEEARRVAKAREDLEVILIEPGGKEEEAGAGDSRGGDILWIEEQLRDRFELKEELEGRLTVRFF